MNARERLAELERRTGSSKIQHVSMPGYPFSDVMAIAREALDKNAPLEAEIERLREALQFIADQKDKTGNWAVELAKRTLAVESAGGE